MGDQHKHKSLKLRLLHIEDRTPLVDCRIVLLDLLGNLVATGRTDSYGFVEFVKLKKPAYRLKIDSSNFVISNWAEDKFIPSPKTLLIPVQKISDFKSYSDFAGSFDELPDFDLFGQFDKKIRERMKDGREAFRKDKATTPTPEKQEEPLDQPEDKTKEITKDDKETQQKEPGEVKKEEVVVEDKELADSQIHREMMMYKHSMKINLPRYYPVDVFFATNRKGKRCRKKGAKFGSKRGLRERLCYGICKMSIPKDHKMGEIERPFHFVLDFRENPEKHIILESITRLKADDFESSLKSHVETDDNKAGLLFIHGFNTTFEQAAYRTAQMSYDLGMETALMFSWPSKGSWKLRGYTYDSEQVQWAVEHFKEFIKMIASRSGLLKLHIVAHSMGNRTLADALEGIAEDKHFSNKSVINEVVLAAPDIDADRFKNDILPRIKGSAKRFSLYASSHDKALKISESLHGYPRAGNTENGMVIDSNIETIDVSPLKSGFFHHDYYAADRVVINDIAVLMNVAATPKQRNLREKDTDEGKFWQFRK